MAGCLRLVLGDQLSPDISALDGLDPQRDTVLLAEVAAEATYVRHHPKKIAFVLAAMRHFAAELEGRGVAVRYVQLDAPANTGSIGGELARAAAELAPRRVIATEPGEYRLWQDLTAAGEGLPVPLELRDDSRFFISPQQFRHWAEGRKRPVMGHFYQKLRKQTGFLMAEGKPVGGQWSFDAANREPIPAEVTAPPRHSVPPDATTRAVLDLVGKRFGHHFGELDGFDYAVTRGDAEAALADFIDNRLPWFGIYQDAMRAGEPLLFHSRLSVYLNAGLLDPGEVCRRAEAAYRRGHAPLNAVEGFIRQILGWREYVRGVYWWRMPGYAETNALDAHNRLPELYWTGATEMACLADTVAQTRREAYAHHIQRLMVAGTFALLAEVDPKALNHWFLVVYADAYEWVELPNVQGMALFADGGVLATKPYAASGKYIDRMSDYCRQCRYDPKQSLGPDACPFNALYWRFIDTHRERFAGNPRMAFPLKTLARMDEAKRRALVEQGEATLAALAYAEPGAW